MYFFWPMVHRYKKCSDIFKVTSGGRAEIENVKNDQPSDVQFHLCQQMLLWKCHCIFYIYRALGKRDFCQISKRSLIGWITGQTVQRLQNFAILASFLYGNLKCPTKYPSFVGQNVQRVTKSFREAWYNNIIIGINVINVIIIISLIRY